MEQKEGDPHYKCFYGTHSRGTIKHIELWSRVMWKAIQGTPNSCFIYSTWTYSWKQIKKIVEGAEFRHVRLERRKRRRVAFTGSAII